MLNELTELASEASSEKRRELLGRISDMFYNDGRDMVAEQEMALFAEVVTRLLRDIDDEGREKYSSMVAANGKTPRAVALRLASDDAAIAAPILQNSPQLNDDDLVDIAMSRTLDHRVAISRRANISERVTDTLIDFGELEVMQTLLDNSTASISARGFNTIADRSETAESLREKICLRGDVPVEAARKLLPFLNDAERQKMQALIDKDAGTLTGLVRDALPAFSAERSDRAKRRLHLKAVAAKIEGGEIGLDPTIDELLTENRPQDVALIFSELSLLPEKQMVNAVVSRNAEPLLLISKALGLGIDVYLRAEALRTESLKAPPTPEDKLRAEYGKVDQKTAQRTLRFVNVRTSLAKAG